MTTVIQWGMFFGMHPIWETSPLWASLVVFKEELC